MDTPQIVIPISDGKTFPVEQSLISEYEQLYPNIDVKQQLKQLAAWNQANPSRRKSARGIKRHINSWLARCSSDVQSVQSEKSDMQGNITEWATVLAVYFRPLSKHEIQTWTIEFYTMLSPAPADDEIIAGIRAVVSSPQGKPQWLNAWDVIKAIRDSRATGARVMQDTQDIEATVAAIKAEPDPEARWDMICDSANPEAVQAAVDAEGIRYHNPY